MRIIDWLRSRFAPKPPAPRCVVVFDERELRCIHGDGSVERVEWADLQAVFIDTTDTGPFAEDVFFVLVGNSGECVVPQEAAGTDSLLKRLGKLPGFNHDAACQAMYCTENNRFVCWKREVVERQFDWPFSDPRSMAVITLKSIITSDAPILHVVHDQDDGMWQFLDGSIVSEENASVVSLETITRIDPSVIELADLPLGWYADRSAPSEPWQRGMRQSESSVLPVDVNASSELVPEEVLDYGEIFRRGGRNLGDEDFALFKCPNCGQVYLMEYEVDTVYLNASDLSQRVPVYDSSFACVACGEQVPDDTPWIGRRQDRRFAVTWTDLAASEWKWVTQKTRPTSDKG